MSGKRVLVVLFAVAAGGFVYPLAAQQGPAIPQPNPAATQPAPGANQPSPSQPPTPVPGRPGVVPRQIPAPAVPGAPLPQAPQAGQVPEPDPSAAVPPVEQAPPGQPGAPSPQPGFQGRRALQSPPPAAGGMVSLNFNRADLIEIIHIIAQQLRLTYTIDP
ncbi:MAG: hypothetical protein QOF64_2 [Candidatus Binatota bacterium]|nr:hypothetical protein [Candidatus Binatota bacterium]